MADVRVFRGVVGLGVVAMLLALAATPRSAAANPVMPSATQAISAATDQPITEWAATHDVPSPTAADTVPVDMAVGPEGGVVVTGAVDFDRGIETVAYDADGELMWAQLFQPTPGLGYSVRPNAVAIGADGRVYVAGRASDPYEDTGGVPILPAIRPTVIAYSASGEELWIARYGEGDADAIFADYFDIAVDAAGDLYATGNGHGHFMTASYSPSGDERWVKEYQGDLDPPYAASGAGSSVTVGAHGTVYVAGTTLTHPRSGEAQPTTVSATVAYEPDGTELWKRSYDSGRGEFYGTSRAIATTASGEVFVAAPYWTVDASGKTYRCALLSFDSDGTLRWADDVVGYVNAVAADDDGVYLTAGDMGTWAFGREGALRWHNGVKGSTLSVDPAGNVYVSGDTSVALDRDGSVLWHAPVGSVVALGAGGSAYVAFPTPSASDPPVTVLGTAKYKPFDIETPADVSLASVQLGQTSTLTVTLANEGSPGLTLTALALSGSAAFSITPIALPFVLAAGGTLDVAVSFTPIEPGLATGHLVVSSNDPREPLRTVNLAGTGLPRTQTITFPPLADHLYGTVPFALSATATSGLPVTFTTRTPLTCTVAEATVRLVAPGACTVRATQGGNAEWGAAVPVDRSFTIAVGISLLAPPAKATFAPGSRIPVKFRLTDLTGNPLPDRIAMSLRLSVRVAFASGDPVAASYESASNVFSTRLKTPRNVREGASYPITVTVAVGAATIARRTTLVVAK